ncbi:hypothetical protein ADL00_10485 [Streptomyces sp. AS58]|nr:hypothetical protein ADL00_10485 [Streptomyces sp. AS58]
MRTGPERPCRGPPGPRCSTTVSGTRIRAVPGLTEQDVGDATVVVLSGEMDILTTLRDRVRLDALTAGPCPDLVLDLRAVSFIDCSGLGMLCRTANRVGARHGRLRLVTDDPYFLRLLRLSGLSGAFELCTGLPGTPL